MAISSPFRSLPEYTLAGSRVGGVSRSASTCVRLGAVSRQPYNTQSSPSTQYLSESTSTQKLALARLGVHIKLKLGCRKEIVMGGGRGRYPPEGLEQLRPKAWWQWDGQAVSSVWRVLQK